MRKILVLGGTRFFGRGLVDRLRANGDSVTIASRRDADLVIDRDDRASLAKAFQATRGQLFDVIYDQICYAPTPARDLCELSKGAAKLIIETSTQSVYEDGGEQREEHFDPLSYPERPGQRADFDYGEGKRLAEAAFARRATVPVAMVRFPYVVGDDDYTGRFDFHVKRCLAGQPIASNGLGARTSFIHRDEAADFLFWLGQAGNFRPGPVNACATGDVTLEKLFTLIGEACARHARLGVIDGRTPDDAKTPYTQTRSGFMSNARASAYGFSFSRLDAWLPEHAARRAAALR